MHNYRRVSHVVYVPVWRSKGKGRKKIIKFKPVIRVRIVHLTGPKSDWSV